MVQFFKETDLKEKRVYEILKPLFDNLSNERDLFFTDSYSNFMLGQAIWDADASPLANVIPREIFRTSFSSIFESFLEAGSFEGYLNVFRQVFGANVDVTFTVPSAGKLLIDIVASDLELDFFTVREIISNSYIYDNLITQDLDNIMLRSVKGITTQYELEQMLFELVPSGIYTQITLTAGA